MSETALQINRPDTGEEHEELGLRNAIRLWAHSSTVIDSARREDLLHVFVGTREILIRPNIPPTNTHAPFANAKQRVYMSVTLGEGGDLERLTGRKRLPVCTSRQVRRSRVSGRSRASAGVCSSSLSGRLILFKPSN